MKNSDESKLILFNWIDSSKIIINIDHVVSVELIHNGNG